MAIPNDIKNYVNRDVISNFRKSYDVSEAEANDLFQEMKKWLWLCAKAKSARKENDLMVPKRLSIFPGMFMIDEMWHTFILFTADYLNFCNAHLGTFIHHRPDGESSSTNGSHDVKIQMSYIYDHLGEETVTLWFVTYPEKYSAKNIRILRR
jgi:hypothetical protein